MLKFFKNLFSSEVTREKYPKKFFPVWEFIPEPDGAILARVYTNPLQEQRFQTQKAAQKWVHTVMAAFKENA